MGHTILTALPPSTVHRGGFKIFLEATLVRREDLLPDTVSKLIDWCAEKGVRIGMLAVDREFFSAGIIGVLKSKNVQFLMSRMQTKGVKTTIDEFKIGKRDAISQNVLTFSNANKRQEKFTLIILERGDRKEKNSPYVCHQCSS